MVLGEWEGASDKNVRTQLESACMTACATEKKTVTVNVGDLILVLADTRDFEIVNKRNWQLLGYIKDLMADGTIPKDEAKEVVLDTLGPDRKFDIYGFCKVRLPGWEGAIERHDGREYWNPFAKKKVVSE